MVTVTVTVTEVYFNGSNGEMNPFLVRIRDLFGRIKKYRLCICVRTIVLDYMSSFLFFLFLYSWKILPKNEGGFIFLFLLISLKKFCQTDSNVYQNFISKSSNLFLV